MFLSLSIFIDGKTLPEIAFKPGDLPEIFFKMIFEGKDYMLLTVGTPCLYMTMYILFTHSGHLGTGSLFL